MCQLTANQQQFSRGRDELRQLQLQWSALSLAVPF
jgi:hypothetical protein